MGISLFAFSAIGVWLQIKILGKRKFTTVTGKGYRPRVIDVGSLRWLLFTVAVFYLLVAVILPLAALVYASLLRFITSDFATARFTLANFDYILFQYPTTPNRHSQHIGAGGRRRKRSPLASLRDIVVADHPRARICVPA
jgi:iron(III) transport system permease protein